MDLESSFDILKVIGKGSFGKVLLVRKKDDGKVYALKTLQKAMLYKRRQILHTMTERNILEQLTHPFLTTLVFAFQTKDKLYMGLNYCGGGDIFFRLSQDKRFPLQRVRFYGSEILLGLEYLHSLDIIFRDMKTENLLLDMDGHISLTDFGLAKEAVTGSGIEGGTKTFCGTPEYLAPEMLENCGHGKGVDWWALGIVLFEMLTGFPPFYHRNTQIMYKDILTAPVRFPPHIDVVGLGAARQGEHSHTDCQSVKSVLTALLQKKVEDRLGCGPGGATAIREHPFFSVMDFAKVLAKGCTPDFVPSTRSDKCTRNFATEFTRLRPEDSIVAADLQPEATT
jgi:serum/glucocorticoid-regulated kinase 2